MSNKSLPEDMKRYLDEISLNSLDISKSLIKIADYIKYKEEYADRKREELNSYSRDVEIRKLNDEIKSLRNKSIAFFEGNEKELYNSFRQKHYSSCKGSTEIIIKGTALGNCIICRCDKCGNSEDITDVSQW